MNQLRKEDHIHEVPRFEISEIELESLKRYDNPFADIVVTGIFTAPSGRKLTAYG